MSKFKVGDKVRALVETLWCSEGDVGVIVPNSDGDFKVNFEDGRAFWFCDDKESSFELVEPKVKTNGGLGGAWGSSRLADNKLFDEFKKDCLFSEPPKHLSFGCVMNPKVTTYPNPPHIHKDLIIAWANGAVIEVSDGDGVFYETSKPEWIDTLQYRIKSTKTPLQLKIEKCEAKLVKLKGQL